MALLEFLLQRLDGRHVELSVEQQYAVTLVLSSLDIGVLLFLVCGVEIDELVVLVLLISLDECLILVEGELFAFCIFHQSEVLGTIIESFFCKDTIVDEELQVVPLLLILLAVLLEDAIQTVSHFLGDVG